ncbi:diaminopimelate decarboxylase [Spirochaetia bacterium]|nr:diaminopimelate decarboxylase [Spirochaetia bacterium]
MADRITLVPEQAKELINKYGSPLYVYDEGIIRERCREVRALSPYPGFLPNYSAKANTNIELLKIVKDEGLHADAMSPGEILAEEAAGFRPEELLFISNNVSVDEMRFALDRGIMISVDSLSQLAQYGAAFGASFPRVAFRLNPGIGAGHSAKVVTGGKSKFGIEQKDVNRVQEIARTYGLVIAGIDQHIGSLFLNAGEYLAAADVLFETAREFPNLAFIDLGGGLGVPYKPGEPRLDMRAFGQQLSPKIADFTGRYANHTIRIMIEPGRYISAESCILLGTVHSVKENYGETYIGTDIGFNVLMRPVLYDSWHDIRIFTANKTAQKVTVTGNICESGDILARDRDLPLPEPGDLIGVENAGAYGYAMASNYNSRLRPAEVLIALDGKDRLIRRRDTYEDLLRQL